MSKGNKDTAEVDAAEVASIHDIGPPPLEADYVNPADKTPRWLLSAHTFLFRCLAGIGFGLGNRSGVPPPSPTETIWLDSTLGEWKGKQTISADVWIPPDTQQQQQPSSGGDERESRRPKRPAVINFHGGGYILGRGTDDARWADAVMRDLGAVVFSVNYRLAPGYSFPTPPEDCADAILQICRLADRYDVDAARIVLSGFSAGATLALTSWVILQDGAASWDYEIPSTIPKIAGFVLYYPMLDWTLDRHQKRAACKRPDLTLPSSVTDIIDASYLRPPRPRRERDDPRLSPGLMSDALVDRLPPVHLCLCEHDMLLAEGRLFAERLEGHGRTVSVRVVEGAKHAWDKPPPLVPLESVAFEYEIATAAVKSWFGGEGKKNNKEEAEEEED